MSSHHFVREDQEPALLIIDPDAIAFEKVQELLEWSPLVIVSHQAIEVVQEWGIKIDVLFASPGSESLPQIAIDQAPLQVIYSPDEFASVCELLINRKQIHLNVIVSDATDYFTKSASFSDKVNVVLFDGKARWHFVANGLYSKWLPAQSLIQIFMNNTVEKNVQNQTGIFKIERPGSFWVGEEF